MKQFFARWKKWLVPACYGVAILLWLGLALLHFAGDRLRGEAVLKLSAAGIEEMAEEAPGLYRTEGVDPKFIFEGLDAKVRTVRLDAEFSVHPGEMELFWSSKEGQGFSLAKRVTGIPQDDGSYLYVLPAGRVRALRLDPGTAKDNTVAVAGITLNPRLPASHYFLPSLRDLLALALLPALAACAITYVPSLAGVLRRCGKPL